jgi:APA family basic amino acid/polyamine antiporter
MHAPARLSRSIGLLAATAMVVGTILGASIFVQPSVVTARVPSVGGVFAAWLLAGALTLIGALVCAELGSALPKSGGVYVFLREAWGPGLGFLWGWAMLWSMHSGIVAAIATVFARYAAHFAPLGADGVKAVAIAAILLLSAVNYLGVREGSRLQTVLTAAKVGAVVIMVAVAFALGGEARGTALSGESGVAGDAAPTTLSNLLLATSAGLFAFGGWHMVTYAAEETVAAERTIPRALLVGTLAVTGCYVALNAAYLYVLPLEAVTASRSVAADAARAVLGEAAAAAVAGVVVLSTLGALNGVVLAGPRVYYAMAKDGLLFAAFGRVHERFRTPHAAILLQAAWASVLAATDTYEQLVGRVVYTEWIFFALMALGMLRLRARAGYAPAYRLAGGGVLAPLFALTGLAVAARQIAAEPVDSAIGLSLVLVGLPVFALWRPSGTPGRVA